jgi:hypothetical protein
LLKKQKQTKTTTSKKQPGKVHDKGAHSVTTYSWGEPTAAFHSRVQKVEPGMATVCVCVCVRERERERERERDGETERERDAVTP